jgi:hypothetical protein
MADARKLWQKAREYEHSLPPQDFYYVTSIGDELNYSRSGMVTKVPRDLVGQLVVGGSHRLSTEEEIESSKKAEHEHLVQQKMTKINTDNQKSVELFEAMQRLAVAQMAPVADAKKGK